jgi:hypothetical protein
MPFPGLGVEQAVVSPAATEQPENLYLHSFRLFSFPTGFSVYVFQGYKPHECLIATPVGKHLFSDTQLKYGLISNGGG